MWRGFSKRQNGRAFLMQPCRQTARRCVLNHAFQGKETGSGDYGRLDLFIVSPTIHATMGVKILLSSWFMIPSYRAIFLREGRHTG